MLWMPKNYINGFHLKYQFCIITELLFLCRYLKIRKLISSSYMFKALDPKWGNLIWLHVPFSLWPHHPQQSCSVASSKCEQSSRESMSESPVSTCEHLASSWQAPVYSLGLISARMCFCMEERKGETFWVKNESKAVYSLYSNLPWNRWERLNNN